MRHKLSVHATVVAGLVLGFLVFGSVVAAADGKRGGDRTLRLKAIEQQFAFLDLGEPGASLGDQIVFSETLYRRGRRVGESGAVCTVTKMAPPYGSTQSLHCVGTLSLRRGQITVQGLIEVQSEDDPGPFDLAITGGTGAYTGAGGTVVVRSVSERKSIYKLRFDKKPRHKRH